ncbi:MAG: hypothetical protein WAV27_13445 [Xanthobacteraceae bacterium]
MVENREKRIRKMLSAGRTLRETGVALGISHERTRQIAKSLGIVPPRSWQSVRARIAQRLVALNRQNTKSKKVRRAIVSRNADDAPKRSDNTSGFTGVWRGKNGQWRAEIAHIKLGSFDTPEAAAAAYRRAAKIRLCSRVFKETGIAGMVLEPAIDV